MKLGHRGARNAGWVVIVALVACVSEKTLGQQCIFNDDCVAPLVCAALRCRVQCRSDRDCFSPQLCAPADQPAKRVCLSPDGPSLCASDEGCPTGARCVSSGCWWSCRDDATCTALTAGSCSRPENVCSTPITALALPRDAGVADDVPKDVAAADAPVADAPFAQDVTDDRPLAPTDAGFDVGVDAPPDAATDAPSDAVDAGIDRPAAMCVTDADCFFDHATGRCNSGRCAFVACVSDDAGTPQYSNCDGDPLNGCEVALRTDGSNCGVCNRVCNLGPHVGEVQCVGGACQRSACAVGFGDCNGSVSDGCETDLTVSASHCGACGNACPDFALRGGVATTCRAGACAYTMCASGRADCDGDVVNGCEVDLLTSRAHCGRCGGACATGANQTVACVGGACNGTCATGYADCNATPTDGCERDLTVDVEHCGACNNRCLGTQVCAGGSCRPSPFAVGDAIEVFAPTTSMTLAAGVHRYASVRIPAGVRVTVGTPGILEIYARGDVVIEGTIEVSGGRGGNGAAGSSACVGGNGGGGDTGTGTSGETGAAGLFGLPGDGGDGSAGGDAFGAGAGAGMGGTFGGGSGGPPTSRGAAGGGGGWAGGGGGGGAAGCTFCGSGAGGGPQGGQAAGSSQGAPAVTLIGFTLYHSVGGTNGASGSGGGGGAGGVIGLEAARDTAIESFFHPGSGGGGGGAPDAAGTGACVSNWSVGGGGGGGGGGALRLASATRIVVSTTGAVLANGGAGGDGALSIGGASSAGGGGGSGGALALVAPRVEVAGTMSAAGGAGGTAPVSTVGVGGRGGLGRIRVSVVPGRCSLGGSWTPQLAAGCELATAQGRVAVVAYP